MLRALGAVLVIGGCGYTGLKIGDGYRLRTEVLRSLQNGLNLLETEISYVSTPLPQALQRVGEKLSQSSSVLFLHAAQLLQSNKGITASEAWDEGIKALKHQVPTVKEEISILTIFGRSLGCSAKAEQLKNIALAREQLIFIEKQAVEARRKYEKMWQYLGFCLGATIVLMLL
jgi:stage III sporulation protein AB